MARSARWRSYQHFPRLNIFLEIGPTQCVIERVQNQGSFIDAPTRIADRVRLAQIPPPASSSPQTSTSRFYWIHVPSKNSGLVPQVLWRISEERGDANLHPKLLLDGPWLVLHPRFSPTVRQRRLCKPIRQVGICGTRRRDLGRWSYSIPDLWLWILDARTVIPFVPQKEQDDIDKGSNILKLYFRRHQQRLRHSMRGSLSISLPWPSSSIQ